MNSVQPCELPTTALLRKYASGGYADCFVTTVDKRVEHPEFVESFYTTGLFKLERFILRWLAARPSTDLQAQQLAAGASDTFAAWRVEGREVDQILLADMTGRTRSWLMVMPAQPAQTQLYFGSAVVPRVDATTGERKMGPLFRALLGFHKWYSLALLSAARRRVLAHASE